MQVTDEGLETVARLTQLRSLNVAGCTIGPPGLQQLAEKLCVLESLSIGGCGRLSTITNPCLNCMHGAWESSLTSLDLSGCPEVHDSGTICELWNVGLSGERS